MADAAQNVEAIHRLTPTQEGILFHAEGGTGRSDLYLQQFACELPGVIDEARFQGAWDAVVARHAALRTLYTWRGRPHPLGVVRGRAAMPLELRADVDLDALIAEDRARGLDLERAPAMRVTLLRRAGRAWMLWTFHHVALDGWSMRIVLDDLSRAYAGQDPGPAPRVTQAEHVAWLDGQDEAAAREHHRRRLAGWSGPTPLLVAPEREPLDREAGEVSARLGDAESVALRELARRARVTQNVVLRAAFALALERYTDTRDVVFGSTSSGRPADLDGADGAVGMFIETSPVRVSIDPSESVPDWLTRLHGEQLADAPFEHVSLAAVQRDAGARPGSELFDALLVFENHAATPEIEGGLRFEARRHVERSHYPFALLVVPGDTVELIGVHDGEHVRAADASALLDVVRAAIAALAAAGDAPVGDLDVLAPQGSLAVEGDPAPEHAPDVLLEALRVAADDPLGAALTDSSGSLDRAGLARRIDEFAARLRAAGVDRGARVGVAAPRSSDAIALMLAALRVGAAYVPIDPDGPAARGRTIAEDAGAALVVGDVERDLPAGAAGGAGPAPDAPDDVAYVLFTSGSTGRPKGVEVTRGGLAASTAARLAVHGSEPVTFLLLSPLHFDSSVAGIYHALVTGGTLVLPAPGEERDPAAVLRLIRERNVTHTLMLPSLHDALLDADPGYARRLRSVAVAGEACSDALAQRHVDLAPGTELVNEYGPTEATVWASFDRARPGAPMTIGRPIPGVRVYVLDRLHRPVPHGVAGELAIAGPTLARGYAGDAARTDAAFPTIESGEGAPLRVYATGDRARALDGAAGRLDFLGRVDHQVKVRGQRIELGEVESAFAALDGVAEVVARAARDGAGPSRLEVFLTPRPGAQLEPAELRSASEAHLTGAMRPSRIEVLDALPRTPSGKVDRGALPAMATASPPEQASASPAASDARPPRTDAERALAGIWREVLGATDVGVDDDFFALGGDSLSSIRVLARAHRAGVRVTPAQFVESPTIGGMIDVAGVDAATTVESAAAAEEGGPAPASPPQRWFLDLDSPAPDWWNLARVFELGGHGVALGRLERALSAVVARHAALRSALRSGPEGATSTPRSRSAAAVTVHDARGVASVAAALRAIPADLSLARGRLVGAAILDGDERDRLVVVAHHAAVDAASWAILEDDLRVALAGEPLGPPPAPFGAWARALARFAATAVAAEESVHWLELARRVPGSTADPGPVADERAWDADVEAETSRVLAAGAHLPRGVRPVDLVLCAVVHAAAGGEASRVVLDLESHGREGHVGGPDVTRTVGWFTALWPHEVDLTGVDPSADARLRAVAEGRAAVPGNGVGFGALRDHHPDAGVRTALAEMPPRDLLFNHLGQVEGDPVPDEAAVGPLRDPRTPRGHAVEVLTWFDRASGALRVRVQAPGEEIAARSGSLVSRAPSLAGDVAREVERLCAELGSGAPTARPEDFPLAGLDQAGLDRLSDLLGDD